MRRFLSCLALAVAFGHPCAAETVLYSTAASQNRIDAFHVGGDGMPEPSPFEQQATKSPSPRRLVVRGCNLYVAETERVEVFRIRSNGHLQFAGSTNPLKGSNPHDIEIAANGQMLYVPVRQQGALASYPLDEQGIPTNDGNPTSCVYAPGGAFWEDIEISPTNIYAVHSDRVMVYGLDERGQIRSAQAHGTDGAPLPVDDNGNGTIDPNEETCPEYNSVPAPIRNCDELRTKPVLDRDCWFSVRKKLGGGTGLLLANQPTQQTLIIGMQFTHRLVAYTLDATGNLQNLNPDGTLPKSEVKKARKKEKRSNRTDEYIRYIGVTGFQPPDTSEITIYGVAYVGETDTFRLDDAGKLTKSRTSQNHRDRTSSPTRSTVATNGQGNPVLYVAAGERDRVQVYRLFPQGDIPPSEGPEMETDELGGSYPNDVVLADITSCD
jgi:6-phosphogluconolactonase (cycloisomerase 2 family)